MCHMTQPKIEGQSLVFSFFCFLFFFMELCFPCGSAGKESACNAGDLCSVPKLGRYPEEGNAHPLHYSGMKNSMDCIVHGDTKSWT